MLIPPRALARNCVVLALGLFLWYLLAALSLLPPRLFDPLWQQRASTTLMAAAPLPLAGLLLIQFGGLLDPANRRLQRLWRPLGNLALLASAGFLLLIPLQLYGAWSSGSLQGTPPQGTAAQHHVPAAPSNSRGQQPSRSAEAPATTSIARPAARRPRHAPAATANRAVGRPGPGGSPYSEPLSTAGLPKGAAWLLPVALAAGLLAPGPALLPHQPPIPQLQQVWRTNLFRIAHAPGTARTHCC